MIGYATKFILAWHPGLFRRDMRRQTVGGWIAMLCTDDGSKSKWKIQNGIKKTNKKKTKTSVGTPAFPHSMSSVPRGHAWPRKQVASRFPVVKGWFEAIKASATTACPPQYTDFASSKHLGCCHWIWDSSHRGFPANSPTVLQRQTLGSSGTTFLLLNPLFNLTRSVRTRLFTTRPLGGWLHGVAWKHNHPVIPVEFTETPKLFKNVASEQEQIQCLCSTFFHDVSYKGYGTDKCLELQFNSWLNERWDLCKLPVWDINQKTWSQDFHTKLNIQSCERTTSLIHSAEVLSWLDE